MKRFWFFQIISSIVLLLNLENSLVNAQKHYRRTSPVTILGWSDDSHYLIRTTDAENKSIVQKVDIKSGKSIVVQPEKSELEILLESLPENAFLSLDSELSSDMKSVVLPMDNDLYYFKTGDTEIRRLTGDSIPEVNSRFSPDGKRIAYTKNKDLYVFDLESNKEIRLTFDATDKIYNGYSSWVYMEEILGRPSKYAAFWWSPDGTKLAYLRTDETLVPVFTLNRADETAGIHGQVEATPYPKPGDPNPKVRMGIADVLTAKTTWANTDYSVDQYLAWPFWTPDSKKLAIQVVNREQNDITIILADPASGNFTKIYNETRPTWVDFFQDIYVLENGSGFIVRSYRNDWENLYLYGWDGNLIKQLTDFSFMVTDIYRVDEEAGIVYFAATGKESTDKHAFRVGLDGRNLLQLTSGNGTHSINISPKGTWFLDTWNNISSPGSIVAIDKKGKFVREAYKFPVPAEVAKQELLRIMTSDGLFNMPAVITYPVNFDPSKKYPVVFTIYGGPASPNISNSWSADEPSWYSFNNIITFSVDHRGSGQFGRKGTDYIHRCLGKWEMLDYQDAVKWLRNQPYVDGTKMGMTGSSYGGYMTCLALTKGADYWTHGFAGSSVTDWRFYDNVYTERFMDMPTDNKEGYDEGSVLSFVKNFKGKLYLTHGEMDDNVHMQNSLHLISKLQDQGSIFEFMIYPGGRHGWGGAKAVHSRNEAHNFWLKNFFNKAD